MSQMAHMNRYPLFDQRCGGVHITTEYKPRSTGSKKCGGP